MIVVSACLIGLNCRYNGKNSLNLELLEKLKSFCIIPICPEIFGGLPIPRECCEIVNGDGFDVLRGKARVISKSGIDYTDYFVRGAREVLKIVRMFNIEKAILKDLSPSCGVKRIYDGKFKGNTKRGVGVTVALLKIEGIEVMLPEEFLNTI